MTIPDMAKRIHVRGRDAVVRKSVVIDDHAAGTLLVDLNELLLGGEWTAEGHGSARLHQSSGLDTFLGRDEIHRSLGVVVSPSTPVASPRQDFLCGCERRNL